ncbi:MAG: zinc metallopeptidase [Firmicutes bacterium]|nr:zinc metallopeptidase [Bacillota bacterium]
MFPLFYDPTMIIVLPAIILAMYAQAKVQGTFRRYLNVQAYSGLTGAQVAQDLLRRQGLHEVRVEMVPGNLTDHYDPRSKVVRLSNPVYNGHSLAALGVAAHETGHAIQHATHYLPLNIRHSLVPVANIGSQLGLPLAIIGIFFFQSQLLLQTGIILFAGAVLFQVVTLPVEYNASSRALTLLEEGGYLRSQELGGAKEVLNAAALTYVAATLVALLHLVRLLLLASRFSGNRRR